MEKFKNLFIPTEKKEGALKRCVIRAYGCGKDINCPSADLKNGCGDCLADNDSRDTLREYLNRGGKDVSEGIDQEKLCEYCRDYYEESVNWHCEGIKCEEITEMYLEDNPHINSKENKMNKNISEVFDKTKDALLVEKHLGNQLGTTFINGLILADKKTEVLAEAKRLEKEEKDNK